MTTTAEPQSPHAAEPTSATVDISNAALFILVPGDGQPVQTASRIPKPQAARILHALADTIDQEWKSEVHAEQKRLRAEKRTNP